MTDDFSFIEPLGCPEFGHNNYTWLIKVKKKHFILKQYNRETLKEVEWALFVEILASSILCELDIVDMRTSLKSALLQDTIFITQKYIPELNNQFINKKHIKYSIQHDDLLRRNLIRLMLFDIILVNDDRNEKNIHFILRNGRLQLIPIDNEFCLSTI